MKQSWILVLIVACTSTPQGSGVPGSKRIIDLDDTEDRSVCTYVENLAGPERTIMCSDGSMLKVGVPAEQRQTDIDECVRLNNDSADNYPMCELTVEDLEGCREALAALTDAQWCDDSAPPPAACEEIYNPTPSCGGVQ